MSEQGINQQDADETPGNDARRRMLEAHSRVLEAERARARGGR